MSDPKKAGLGAVKTWRDVLAVHPAADAFPLMSETDPAAFQALVEDIQKNGLQQPIVVYRDDTTINDGDRSKWCLLDGRNRMDALELLGFKLEFRLGTRRPWRPEQWVLIEPADLADLIEYEWHGEPQIHDFPWDPLTYVISANIHRRHLTAEQKRGLIAELLKATPEKSNRQIAETVKVDHKTVASVRAEKVATGEIPQLEKTTGKDGKNRGQPAKPTRRTRNLVTEIADADDNVASPAEIRKSILDSVERQVALARSFKKNLRVASLNQAMRDEVSAALGTLITTVQSLQRALAAPEVSS